jgi:hypothetical protein
MSLQSDLISAEQALTVAEQVVAAAKVRYDELKAKADAAAPHLAVWADAKAWVAKFGQEAEGEFRGFVERAHALFGSEA